MGAFRGDLDDELTLLPIWKHVCFSRRIEAIGKVAAPICFSDHQMSRQVAVIWNTRCDVAGAAVFLASSDASFIAGTELSIDGGQAQV